MADQILFDRLAYMDRLKRAGIPEEHARAHAEAIEEALRESVATKQDIGLVRHEIELLRMAMDVLRRDLIITIGTAAVALFAALVGIKFFA